MARAYIQFVELFGRLSPYELKHFSECLLCKIEEEFEEKLCGVTSRTELTEKDIKFSITEAMQELMLELGQQELQIQQMKLEKTKALVFSGHKVVA